VLLQAPSSMTLEALRAALKLASGVTGGAA